MPVLEKNLLNLKLINNFEIIKKDIYKDDVFNFLNYKFDIIFLDPPYKDKHLENLLIKIKDQKILSKNGIIIIHRHKKEKEIFSSNFNIIEEKNMGFQKYFLFLSKVKFSSFLLINSTAVDQMDSDLVICLEE